MIEHVQVSIPQRRIKQYSCNRNYNCVDWLKFYIFGEYGTACAKIETGCQSLIFEKGVLFCLVVEQMHCTII